MEDNEKMRDALCDLTNKVNQHARRELIGIAGELERVEANNLGGASELLALRNISAHTRDRTELLLGMLGALWVVIKESGLDIRPSTEYSIKRAGE